MKIVLVQEKQCKGSVRYVVPASVPKTEADKLPVTNAYINRAAFPGGMPDKIELTVAAAA